MPWSVAGGRCVCAPTPPQPRRGPCPIRRWSVCTGPGVALWWAHRSRRPPSPNIGWESEAPTTEKKTDPGSQPGHRASPPGGLLRGGPGHPEPPGRPGPAPPLTMSASSSGSFHSSLYLLAVSMTLAAVYLWGAKGELWQAGAVGAGKDSCSPAAPAQPRPSHSQAHGAAPQGTRFPL